MPSMNAAENPDLANQIIDQVMSSTEEIVEEFEAEISSPPETVFDLPGGYVLIDGSVLQEAEVRELTGRDEEAIVKLRSPGASMNETLKRGLIRLGETTPDSVVLEGLLAGDRDYIMLRIFAATFGSNTTATRVCPSCAETVDIEVDILDDVPIKRLDSPSDRIFTVDCKVGPVQVTLPTGHTQKQLLEAGNKNIAELSTILLASTVTSINGLPVLGPQQILDLPIRDRRKIAEEIGERNPGPQLQDITKPCPSCEVDMEVPVSLAALFQF